MSIARISLGLALLVGLTSVPSGCTLAQIAQLRKPQAAQPVAGVSFPEVERMLPTASYKWAPDGQNVRTYITDSNWREMGDGSGRFASLVMYYERKGGALVKGDDGSEDRVCFEYPCALNQQRVPAGLSHPVVECNDALSKKVTCSSVQALPAGVATTSS